MLIRLYARFGIDDTTDLDKLTGEDYPLMNDLYELCEKEFRGFDHEVNYIYTEDTLQNICLGIVDSQNSEHTTLRVLDCGYAE